MKKRSLLLFATIAAALVLLLPGTAPADPSGTIHYVNATATGANNGTSWQDAFTDLQSAINGAVAGDTIWVAAGTYRPSTTIDGSSDPRSAAFILKSGVALYGGFAGDENVLQQRDVDPSVTILSGDIGEVGDDTDNSYHVVYADGVTDAQLDGFTVTGGLGDAAGRASRGAGMYNHESSLTVSNCIFSHNRVTGTVYGTVVCGAGMYNEDSAPTVIDCTFTDNLAGNVLRGVYGQGGGMYNAGTYGSYPAESGPRVIGCTFTGNAAGSAYADTVPDGGGGMYNGACGMNGMPAVDSCTFAGNSGGNGGAMLNYLNAPTITNCVFDANFTTYSDGLGGALFNLASPTILNCTFYRNGWRLLNYGSEPRLRPYTYLGGAIYQYRGASHLTNCIFSDNAVKGRGGAIAYSSVRGGSLTNCLFSENISWWPNSHGPDSDHVLGTPMAFEESGNLYDVDPLFVMPSGGDFHLQKDSPGIDAGDYHHFGNFYWAGQSAAAVPATDYYGARRVIDGDGDTKKVLDIGAAEYVPNLTDLRVFLQGLADLGEIDAGLATRLLASLDAAQAAVDQDQPKAAIGILKDLSADAQASLGDTATAQAIQSKTEAVIERL